MNGVKGTEYSPLMQEDHAAQTNTKERERIMSLGGVLRQHLGAWRVGETGLAAGWLTHTVPLFLRIRLQSATS